MNTWIPFLWALIAVGISLILVMIEVLKSERELHAAKKSLRLRDKAHLTVVQNRGYA